MKLRLYILLVFFVSMSTSLLAQSNKKFETCEEYLNEGFISDGQYNIALIKKGETKISKVTFLSGNTFRIIACAEHSDQLEFTIKDQEGTTLFSNKNFEYAPYWDFEITNTMECTISLFLNDNSLKSDKTILIIGYKR